MRLVFLLLVCCGFSFAEDWSGALVDAKCYDARDRNVNPNSTTGFVDRDRNADIRYCAPRPKTKSFSVVQPDGTSVYLDAAGNAKAAEFARTAGKVSPLRVTVSGETNGKAVRVDTISFAR
jgi:hypothetical protein